MSAALKPEPVTEHRVGRPRVHDRQQVMLAVCELMARGHTTESAAKRCGTNADIIRIWSRQDPMFGRMYAQAREDQAHAFAEQVIAVADGTDPIADPDAAIRKVQVDARKWFTAKIAPKLYGDRLETNVTVRVEALHLTALEAPALHTVVPTQIGSGETVDAEVVDAHDVSDD